MSTEGREFKCQVCGLLGQIHDIGVVESVAVARVARYYHLNADGLCMKDGRRDVVILNEG